MTGLQKIFAKLQSMYFNLLGTLSGALYSFRQAIVDLSSTVLSAVQSVVSIWKEEHLIWTQTYMDVVQMLKSSTGLKKMWSLISSFGSLVMKAILIGFTSVTFTMGIIVNAVSKLVETIRARRTTK